MLAGALLAAAVMLAAVVPPALARAGWPERAPRLAIALWQAMAWSVISAVVLAGLAMAAAEGSVGHALADLLSACVSVVRVRLGAPDPGALLPGLGALVALGVVLRALACVAVALVGAGLRRRRHRAVVEVVARRSDRLGVLVLDHPRPAAYCLPGRRGRIVVTHAALAELGTREVEAVVEHERAHLVARHDLAIGLSAGLARAFPRVPVFALGLREVRRLVELAADDRVRRRARAPALASALVKLACGPVPEDALPAADVHVLERVGRLLRPTTALPAAARVAVAVAIAALVLGPALALAPLAGAAGADHCPVPTASHA